MSRATATGTMLSAPAGAHTLQSPALRAEGEVEFTYAAPDISEAGDRITWKWSVVNTGDAPVSKVVLTHKITPQLTVSNVSPNCEVEAGGDIKCKWDTLGPNETAKGAITAVLPPDLNSGAQIEGLITWEPAREAAPAEDPSV